MTVSLDSGSKTTKATITGGGLTLGATDNSTNGARADTIRATSGKFVFECAPALGSLAVDTGFGIEVSATPNYSALASGPTNGLIIYRSGQVFYNGAHVFNCGGINGLTTMFAIDLDNNLGFVINDANGWNGSLTANPSTGTGGLSISAITGLTPGVYPVGLITSLANAMTFNFGGSLFSRSIPTGYSSWDAAAAVLPTRNAVLLQRGAGFYSTIRALATKAPTGVSLALTERRDTFAATIGNNIGVAMAATEQSDTFAAAIAIATVPRSVNDSEWIYGPTGEATVWVPGELVHSPFVIPSELILDATE